MLDTFDSTSTFPVDVVIPTNAAAQHYAAALHPVVDAVLHGLDGCIVFKGKPHDGALSFVLTWCFESSYVVIWFLIAIK